MKVLDIIKEYYKNGMIGDIETPYEDFEEKFIAIQFVCNALGIYRNELIYNQKDNYLK